MVVFAANPCITMECLAAHQGAAAAGVHHLDISISNMLTIPDPALDGERKGLLIDWEFAKYLDDKFIRAVELTVHFTIATV